MEGSERESKFARRVIGPLFALGFLVPGCQEGAEPTEEEETGGADDDGLPPIDEAICDGMEFDNAVDEATCDEIYGRGIEPEFADEIELCRRLFADLTGALPTRAEFKDTCEGRSVDAIVDDLMDRDEYVQLGQRRWADHFLMTSQVTLFNYIADLDELSGQLYRGEISLPKFAELTTTHPGFTGRFDGQDLVGYSFQAFLGRDAAPHERLGLEPLWHMWGERFEERHPLYYFGYSRVVINTILCMGSFEGACHSDLWGHHSVVIPVVEEDNYDYEGVNVFDVSELWRHWQELRLPGRLIAQQPTFYETAADRALERYLGYDLGFQIPLARQRLVDLLNATGGDVRALDREVLTSELYAYAAAFPEEEGTTIEESVPDFWHGPMKQLTAEAWLDSIEKLGEVEIGHCDHRYPSVQAGRPLDDSPYEDTVWHPSNYPLDPDWPPEQNKPDYTYAELARQLGGCPDQQGQLRFTGTGVMIAIGYSSISRAVCENAVEGSALFPDGAGGGGKSQDELLLTVEDLYRSIMIRSLPEDMDEPVAEAIEGCRDVTECEPLNFTQNTCIALLESAPFIFY